MHKSRSQLVALKTHVGCSSTAERRAVNAETTSSTLASRPKHYGAKGCAVEATRFSAEQYADSNPVRPAIFLWGCSLVGRKRCIVNAKHRPNQKARSMEQVVSSQQANPPQKFTKTISALITRKSSWNLVLKEIAKCDVVCANCHRRRTYLRCGSYRVRDIG